MPILVLARPMPIVRTNRPILDFCVSIRRGPRRTYFVVLRWISMRLRRLSIPNWEKAMVPSGCSGS